MKHNSCDELLCVENSCSTPGSHQEVNQVHITLHLDMGICICPNTTKSNKKVSAAVRFGRRERAAQDSQSQVTVGVVLGRWLAMLRTPFKLYLVLSSSTTGSRKQ